MPQIALSDSPVRILSLGGGSIFGQNSGIETIYLSDTGDVSEDNFQVSVPINGSFSWPGTGELYAAAGHNKTADITYVSNGATVNNAKMSGDVTVVGDITIGEPVVVTGDVSVSGEVGITGPVTVSGDVAVSGPVTVNGDVGVSGNVGVTGPVTVTGDVAVSGPVAVTGDVGLTGPVEISGPVAIAGTIPVSVGDAISIAGTVPVSGPAGAPIEVSGDVSITGGVAIAGVVPISGNVGVTGPVAISGTVPISGDVNLTGGSVAVTGPVTVNGGVNVTNSELNVGGAVGQVSKPIQLYRDAFSVAGGSLNSSRDIPFIDITGYATIVVTLAITNNSTNAFRFQDSIQVFAKQYMSTSGAGIDTFLGEWLFQDTPGGEFTSKSQLSVPVVGKYLKVTTQWWKGGAFAASSDIVVTVYGINTATTERLYVNQSSYALMQRGYPDTIVPTAFGSILTNGYYSVPLSGAVTMDYLPDGMNKRAVITLMKRNSTGAGLVVVKYMRGRDNASDFIIGLSLAAGDPIYTTRSIELVLPATQVRLTLVNTAGDTALTMMQDV